MRRLKTLLSAAGVLLLILRAVCLLRKRKAKNAEPECLNTAAAPERFSPEIADFAGDVRPDPGGDCQGGGM